MKEKDVLILALEAMKSMAGTLLELGEHPKIDETKAIEAVKKAITEKNKVSKK
jgi:hypothetical protein